MCNIVHSFCVCMYVCMYVFTAFASNAFGNSDVSEPSRAVNVSGVCFTLAQLHAC